MPKRRREVPVVQETGASHECHGEGYKTRTWWVEAAAVMFLRRWEPSGLGRTEQGPGKEVHNIQYPLCIIHSATRQQPDNAHVASLST